MIYIYIYVYLTAVGLTPGGSSTSHIYKQTVLWGVTPFSLIEIDHNPEYNAIMRA
jgi:hypothetical protein